MDTKPRENERTLKDVENDIRSLHNQTLRDVEEYGSRILKNKKNGNKGPKSTAPKKGKNKERNQ